MEPTRRRPDHSRAVTGEKGTQTASPVLLEFARASRTLEFADGCVGLARNEPTDRHSCRPTTPQGTNLEGRQNGLEFAHVWRWNSLELAGDPGGRVTGEASESRSGEANRLATEPALKAGDPMGLQVRLLSSPRTLEGIRLDEERDWKSRALRGVEGSSPSPSSLYQCCHHGDC